MRFSLAAAVYCAVLLPALTSAMPPGIGRRTGVDNTCGYKGAGTQGLVCTKHNDGLCCSQHGWCGSSEAHCGTGCQSAFGTCKGGGHDGDNGDNGDSGDDSDDDDDDDNGGNHGNVETDYKCGHMNGGKICRSGYCCSINGWCGTTHDYCAANKCMPSYGKCDNSTPQPTHPEVEKDFTCGHSRGGKVCREGYCCSKHGYCGKTSAYCDAGCQNAFGKCNGGSHEPDHPKDGDNGHDGDDSDDDGDDGHGGDDGHDGDDSGDEGDDGHGGDDGHDGDDSGDEGDDGHDGDDGDDGDDSGDEGDDGGYGGDDGDDGEDSGDEGDGDEDEKH